MLETKLEELRRATLAAFTSALSSDELEEARVRALGRKGELAQITKEFGKLSVEDRARLGKLLNSVKQDLETEYEQKKRRFGQADLADRLSQEWIDATLPAPGVRPGSLHPVTQLEEAIEDLFASMGFAVLDGPEVETEEHNFDALNIPPTHPARDMQDTFWLDGGHLLRTHTSPVQVRG
ncbi:MAG: phenylalanine--tRNA ligase subunit alpha, partial [Bryobacteraceae bacterium]